MLTKLELNRSVIKVKFKFLETLLPVLLTFMLTMLSLLLIEPIVQLLVYQHQLELQDKLLKKKWTSLLNHLKLLPAHTWLSLEELKSVLNNFRHYSSLDQDRSYTLKS